MENHPEDVLDEILGEMGSNLDQTQSDPFQPFEEEPKSPDFLNTLEPSKMITEGANEQNLCENVSQLPTNEPGANSLSTDVTEPSVEQLIAIVYLFRLSLLCKFTFISNS